VKVERCEGLTLKAMHSRLLTQVARSRPPALQAAHTPGRPCSRPPVLKDSRSRPPALMSKKAAEAGGAEEVRQRGQEQRWLAEGLCCGHAAADGVLCSAAGSVSSPRQER
jgi:hypothetical protein